MVSDKTSISWTSGGSTWNPVTGCSKVSDGCSFCYAETLSLRMGWSEKPWAAAYAAENVVLHPDRLGIPLGWKKPRMIFVNSMSDLFHEQVPFDFIDSVFRTICECGGRHVFQILTKRPARMAEWFAHAAKEHSGWFNGRGIFDLWDTWFGVSVENQRAADERIPLLLGIPARVRFLSCEPLLGSLNLLPYLSHLDWSNPFHGDADVIRDLQWVICGGESGSHLLRGQNADRWMRDEWARDLRDQCLRSEIPFFMKQGSGARPGLNPFVVEADGAHTEYHEFPPVKWAVLA